MNRLACVISLLVCTGLAVNAEGADKPMVVDLWPGTPPDPVIGMAPEREYLSDVKKMSVEIDKPTRLITNVSKPTLTFYRPKKNKDTGAAVLICPGGGYWNLFWEIEGEEVAVWLSSIGVTGIILKYRVPRQSDEVKSEPPRRPIKDAQRAISLVRSRAKEWGINPGSIGIMGFSAGGHLAIDAATSFEKRLYDVVDDVDKTSCRPDFAVAVYPGYLKLKEKDELSPRMHVPADTPPIFFAHGSDDTISPPQHSVLMYLALKATGIPAELHVYAKTKHDFGVRAGNHTATGWTQSCATWMRQLGFTTR